MNKLSFILVLFYAIPYIFVSMIMEWMNPPIGKGIVELFIVLPLLILAIICSKAKLKRAFYVGNGVNLIVTFFFVKILTWNESLNYLGNEWKAYFKPFTAEQLSIFGFIIVLLFQLFLFYGIWTISKEVSLSKIMLLNQYALVLI